MDPTHPFFQKLQNSKNVLLVRDDIGKAKTSVRSLPNPSHSYGAKPTPDKEGAGALLSSWQEHSPTKTTSTQKDFKALNRLSIENKFTSPKAVSHFVKDADVKVKEKIVKISRSYYFPKDCSFGIKNKPGTPIGRVVCNMYGNQAEEEVRRIYAQSVKKVKDVEVSQVKSVKKEKKRGKDGV